MTLHNNAKKEDIAPIVLMPGDPMRAKLIAETYLDDYKLVNDVRGIYAYTGNYKGKRITVMASGMGMPSMGIYSYELYNSYDVDTIIRIGSAGSYSDKLNLYDLVLADSAFTLSSYAKIQGNDVDELEASKELNNIIINTAKSKNVNLNVGKIYSSDVFYMNDDINYLHNNKGCLCVEMESFALFYNAKMSGKKAACLLTISDNILKEERATIEERQNSFIKMIELALDSALNIK